MMDERRHDGVEREPARDPELGALLREAERGDRVAGGRRASPEALEALESSVLAAAAPALARLRRLHEGRVEWWEWAAGWSPVAVPVGLLAAAAALVLATRLAPATTGAGPVGLGGVLVERSVSEQSVLAALAVPRAEAVDTLIGPSTRDWLLAASMMLEPPPPDADYADPGPADLPLPGAR